MLNLKSLCFLVRKSVDNKEGKEKGIPLRDVETSVFFVRDRPSNSIDQVLTNPCGFLRIQVGAPYIPEESRPDYYVDWYRK